MTHIDENRLRAALAQATNDEKAEIQALLDELTRRETQARCQQDFLAFVKHIWPSFIEGEHHKRIASLFNEIAFGDKKRLIISLPPRHTKSEFASFLLPAWYLGLYPDRKIIQVSNTAELAEGFGSRVRNLITTEEYKQIFPNVELRADSKARGRWNTNSGGDYFAAGVGAALAGRGGDLCLPLNVVVIVNGKETQLKNIKIGDRIKSVNGWERVTKKSLTIHTESIMINNDLEASLDHPFLTRRGWVQARDLQIGDKILTESVWSKICRMIFHLKNLLENLGVV